MNPTPNGILMRVVGTRVIVMVGGDHGSHWQGGFCRSSGPCRREAPPCFSGDGWVHLRVFSCKRQEEPITLAELRDQTAQGWLGAGLRMEENQEVSPFAPTSRPPPRSLSLSLIFGSFPEGVPFIPSEESLPPAGGMGTSDVNSQPYCLRPKRKGSSF